MATTYTTLIYRVARNLGYTDSSGNVLSGKDLSEDDIKDIINEVWVDEIYPVIADIVPEDFEVTSNINFYNATGTVDASSTASALVTTLGIFTNEMVGYTIYNSTDSESRTITAYTSATEVTVDSDIDDDWDGDTVYILGTKFGLGGDISDMRYPREVRVKYSSTGDYVLANYKRRKEAFEYGTETHSESSPIWYMTSTKQASGVLVNAIAVYPEPSVNVASGIQITYIKDPAALSAGSDTQRLPATSATVYGATAYCAHIIGQEASSWMTLYDRELQRLIKTYAKTRRHNASRLKPPSLLNTFRSRTR
jgi:hypothetical protein